MNSFNTSAWCQKEATYETRFTASFPVMGGGTITLVTHDTNCRTLGELRFRRGAGELQQQRRAHHRHDRPDAASDGPGGGTFTQPRTGSLAGSTYYLQWIWIDVTSVTSP